MDSLSMFWFDTALIKGDLYLFGKIYRYDDWFTIGLQIKDASRDIHVYKSQPAISWADCTKEVLSKLETDHAHTEIVSEKYPVVNEYLPAKGDYLKINLDPKQFTSFKRVNYQKTFKYALGTQIDARKLLLKNIGIAEPCWIKIMNFDHLSSMDEVTTCHYNFKCRSKDIIVLKEEPAIPPLTYLSVFYCLVKDQLRLASLNLYEAQIIFNSEDSECDAKPSRFLKEFKAVYTDDDLPISLINMTPVTKCKDEIDLIEFLLDKIELCDPDVIVGYDLKRFCQCLQTHKKSYVLSRILNTGWYLHDVKLFSRLKGRLMCDIKKMASDLLTLKDYKLQRIIERLLPGRCDWVELSPISPLSNPVAIYKSLDQNPKVIFDVMVAMNAMNIAWQLSCIMKCPIGQLLTTKHLHHAHCLLDHTCNENDYLMPENMSSKNRQIRSIKGGLMIRPMKGFYKNYLVLLDFASLYPSIVVQYQYCMSQKYDDTSATKNAMINRTPISIDNIKVEYISEDECDVEDDLDDCKDNPSQNCEDSYRNFKIEDALLPKCMKSLIEQRREILKKLKNGDMSDTKRFQLRINETAVKLASNSLIGVLASEYSNYHSPATLNLITSAGRDLLLQAKELIEKKGLEVIFGHTDSLLVNLKCREYEDAVALSHQLINEINSQHNVIQIKIDKLFRNTVVYETRKYAGLGVKYGQPEMLIFKGGFIRKNYAPVVNKLSTDILSVLLSDKNIREKKTEITVHCYELAKKLKEKAFTWNDFSMFAKINHELDEYPITFRPPQAEAALRYNQYSKTDCYKAGDTVEYFIGYEDKRCSKSYPFTHFEINKDLNIDVNWYIHHQLTAILKSLFEPFDGFSKAFRQELISLVEINDVPNTVFYAFRCNVCEFEIQAHLNLDEFRLYLQECRCGCKIIFDEKEHLLKTLRTYCGELIKSANLTCKCGAELKCKCCVIKDPRCDHVIGRYCYDCLKPLYILEKPPRHSVYKKLFRLYQCFDVSKKHRNNYSPEFLAALKTVRDDIARYLRIFFVNKIANLHIFRFFELIES